MPDSTPRRPDERRIAWLPGDGIGPEVSSAALRVVKRAARRRGLHLRVRQHLVGGAAIDAYDTPLPEATRTACLAADAVFLGAVGGPQWEALPPAERPERGLLGLRAALGTYANLRPVAVPEALAQASPLRPERVAGTDLLIVRELTGGIYFGTPRGALPTGDGAFNTMVYTDAEIERIAVVAFREARRRRGRVTSVDKANVLEVSARWRAVVTEVHRRDFADVALEHLYVDNAAMQLVRDPRRFDVVLTGNLFGDILSDLAATLPGTLGVLPSASLGAGPGLFEPVHGSAPDLAGRGVANPVAALLSGALMLDHLGAPDAGDDVRHAVAAALADGYRTADMAEGDVLPCGTEAFADAAEARLPGVPAEVEA